MHNFIWRDFFEVGVDFIDEDHKTILGIMQDIQKALDTNDRKTCTSLLNKLITTARDHFIREEQFLEEVKYPELEEHKKYHAELLSKADTTRRLCEGAENKNDLRKYFDDMARFLIDDIFPGDVTFKSHLEYYDHTNGHNKK